MRAGWLRRSYYGKVYPVTEVRFSGLIDISPENIHDEISMFLIRETDETGDVAFVTPIEEFDKSKAVNRLFGATGEFFTGFSDGSVWWDELWTTYRRDFFITKEGELILGEFYNEKFVLEGYEEDGSDPDVCRYFKVPVKSGSQLEVLCKESVKAALN